MAGNAQAPVSDDAGHQEATRFLDSLRSDTGEALAVVRSADGFVDVTLLCQKAGGSVISVGSRPSIS